MGKYAIAVEIGGTKSQVALGTLDGKIIKTFRGKVDISDGGEGIRRWMKENVTAAQQYASDMAYHVDAIGVGFGGPIDTALGKVLKSNQINGWDEFPLRDWFEKQFRVPVRLLNDSNAATWGEYRVGAGKDSQIFVYINIGSGIGGGAVINGNLYDGQGYGACEIGQTLIPDWTADVPGKQTRLELLCSGWSIEKRVRSMDISKDSYLWNLCNGNQSEITCEHLGIAATMQDSFSIAEIDRVACGIGTGVVNVLGVLCPDCIAIGGGVSNLGDTLLDRIRDFVKKHDFDSCRDRYRIEKTELGEDTVLVGALLALSN